MARKDQLSSNKDSCDICGTELDDDAVIQEFPDGSVVRLCSECATAAPPEEELEDDFELEPGDPTEEWTGPSEHHSPADTPRFQPEDLTADLELGSPEVAALSDFADEGEGTSDVAAELAAWASAPSEESELDSAEAELAADFDEEEAHEAALQLMAAIQEADMAEEGDGLGVEVSSETEAAYESGYESGSFAIAEEEDEVEISPPALPVPASPTPVDKTMDLLVPVTDLLTLQTEMQSALARLSSTLEHFVSDMVASEQKSSAITDRLQQLEDELESTRERLRETEALLPDSAYHAVAAIAAATAASDHDLIGTPQDEGTPPPPLPPMPSPEADVGKTGKRKAVATAAAPVVPPAFEAAPPPLPPMPPLPPLPPMPGMPGVAAPALVPPPIGLPVALPLGGPAAPPAFGTAPPPLPPMSAPQPAVRPPVTSAVTPAPKPSVWPAVKPPVDLDDDLGLDDDYDLLVVPTPAPEPAPNKDVPTPKPSAKPAAPADRPKPPATADGTAVDADFMAPLPEPTSHAHSVAGAAAVMGKLLRGRKGNQQPEPEPEPEPEPDSEEVAGLAFSINEVQAAQRLFNESEYTKKIAEISKSIGKPKANVSRTLPGAPEAAITVFWDIVWYQYLVDLRKDLPSGKERVILDREGMDLDELEPRFTEKNGTINDDGRLDASELEIRLLSDPDALITEMEIPMPSPEDRLADDATEEVWDQQSAPDFRWD